MTNGSNGSGTLAMAPRRGQSTIQMPETVDLVPVMDVFKLGAVFAQSGFFTDARSEAQAVVKILAGQEMGIPAFGSMTGIHIIQGRPAVGANLMASAIKRSGRYDYRVAVLDNDTADLVFYENGEELGHSVFTREDAKAAGTQNLAKFARNMLFARAISNGVRWYCPDVFSSAVYTPEELGAEVDSTGRIIEASEAPAAGPPVGRQKIGARSAAPVDAAPVEAESVTEDDSLSDLRKEFVSLAEACKAQGLVKRVPDAGTLDKAELEKRVAKAKRILADSAQPAVENAPPVASEPEDPYDPDTPHLQPVDAFEGEVVEESVEATEPAEPEGMTKYLRGLIAAARDAGLPWGTERRDQRLKALGEWLANNTHHKDGLTTSLEIPSGLCVVLTHAVKSGALVW